MAADYKRLKYKPHIRLIDGTWKASGTNSTPRILVQRALRFVMDRNQKEKRVLKLIWSEND